MRILRTQADARGKYFHLTGGVTVKRLPAPRVAWVCLSSRCIARGLATCCDHVVYVAARTKSSAKSSGARG